MRKYRLLREDLERDGRFEFIPSPFAPVEEIALIHDLDYIRSFLDGTLPAQAMRRIGFPWSENLVARTLASVGGTLSAARDALSEGIGGGLAGGTHHSFPNQDSGFFVFATTTRA